jgi:hypothetical protein
MRLRKRNSTNGFQGALLGRTQRAPESQVDAVSGSGRRLHSLLRRTREEP